MITPHEKFDFADADHWPTPVLKAHVRELDMEQRVRDIPRQIEALDRVIGHACFELYHRAAEDNQYQIEA